jgi:nucleoside-diphosphate-sugar epimerase
MTSYRTAVTGGAGLIGSSLVEELVAQGRDVIVVDDFSRGRYENLAAVHDRIEIREGNLEDPAFVDDCFSEPLDTIYHLASRAFGVAYSEGRHMAILHHNETITNNLLAAMSRTPPGQLLVASSSCVYPDDGPDTIPELPVFTGDPEAVNRGYGWAKRLLEQKATLFGTETETPVAIVRPFNIYGERYNWAGQFSQAIPMLTKRVMDGENPVAVWGSGKQRRSYIHARDCARMMIAILEAAHGGLPVNIGTRETTSINDLVTGIVRAAGADREILNDTTKPEGRFTKSADMTRFDGIVPGFVFEITLEEGLRRMVDWYHETNFPEPLATDN